MSDLTYLIILRLIHITCGIFWAGATIYVALFIQPAVKATGPEGSKFVQQLAKTNKLPIVMMLVALLTVISGVLMIWKLSGGLQSEWMASKHGIVLSTGGAFAIIAFLIGFTVNRPTVAKIAATGKLIAAQGAPPSAEQLKQLNSLKNRLFTATNIVASLLAITVIAMSIVRYL
jgi:hypothetical protein